MNMYASLLNRASTKFGLNIFLLKNSPSFNLNTYQTPHFFIQTKHLKLKNLMSYFLNTFVNYLFFIIITAAVLAMYFLVLS